MISDSSQCVSDLTCTANVCPLDSGIASRSYIYGEKVCARVLDHLEGKETPFDAEILATKEIWTAKYGEKNLQTRVAGREKLRNVVWNVKTGDEVTD